MMELPKRLYVVVLALVILPQLILAQDLVSNASHSICQAMTPSPTLEMFVDPLPRMPYINVSNGVPLTLGAYTIQQQLHRDLPNTTMYAYGTSQATASYPGPTLEAKKDVPTTIRWENHILDTDHMFKVDPTVNWAAPLYGGVPTVTHLHGAEVAAIYDGYPDAWFTAFGEHGFAYYTQNYTYPNSQQPTLLWYHDHTFGITRLNILAGLAGLYIIRPHEELPAWMPQGDHEVTLLIQDKAIYANGSINFPTVGLSVDNHPHWCPEYFGDVILVNGKAWPYLVVEPKKYRFRLVNAGNARVYEFSLSSPNATIVQIGSDGGLLEHPHNLPTLTVAPAERADIIIDFAAVAGQNVTLKNAALVPYPDGDPLFTPPSTQSIMQFRVGMMNPNDTMASPPIPENITVHPVVNTTGALVRTHTMIEIADANDFPTGSLLSNLTWMDRVTETPFLGSTEIWEFINLTPDAHPMHIHLIKFKVLELQAFNLTLYEEGGCDRFERDYRGPGSCITTDSVPPMMYHAGWKDTVTSLPGYITRLVLHWSPEYGGEFPFDATAAPGYLWHCHILDHEDNDMMRPISLIRRTLLH